MPRRVYPVSSARAVAARKALSIDFGQLRSIRLVVFDFDGVFTDNRVLVVEDGMEAVFCSRADALGVKLLQQSGVDCLVLSTEANPVVATRCRKMGVECVAEQWNKVPALDRIVNARKVAWSDVVYVGNDVNDLGCLARVGVPICVADADPRISAVCKLITARPGGNGAVREICEWILNARGVSLADAFLAAEAPVDPGA